MKYPIHMLFLLACLLCSVIGAYGDDPALPAFKCAPEAVQEQDSAGACADPVQAFTPAPPAGSLQLLLPLPGSQASDTAGRPSVPTAGTIVYFFWGKGCPHCEEEKKFLDTLKRAQPSLEIREYEVWYNRENAGLMARMLQAQGVKSSGVPVTFVHDKVFSGFTAQTGALIENEISACRTLSCGDPAEIPAKAALPGLVSKARPFSAPTSAVAENAIAETTVAGKAIAETTVTIPLFGALNAHAYSLPLLTLIIAGMDSFNPCAFFVLLSLLGLLIHAHSRKKMVLIGGIFVFFSALIYFLFMAAWLNLFLVMGHVAVITTIAGAVSVIIGAINIKDFFLFKQGPSLTIPDSAKPRLFDRMRKLLRSTSLASILIGATVLAIVANSYELLCTAGFPMVFTRILTLSNLSTTTYYLYLVLYNIIYVVPLFIIVLAFTVTLGKRQLSEWQGRILKLVSGTMMLGLGTVLLVNPALLNSVWVSFAILGAALGVSLLVAMVSGKPGGN